MTEQTPDPNRPDQPPPPSYQAAPQYSAAPQYTDSYGERPAPTTAPAPLSLAVKLMYVGAAVAIIGAILTLTQRDALREQVAVNGATTPQQLDRLVNAGIAVALVAGLIGAGLWILNAVFNARGAKWARILSTVLGVLAVVFTLYGLTQPAAALSRVLSIIQLILAVVIVFLIWRPESSRYYEAMSAPHR